MPEIKYYSNALKNEKDPNRAYLHIENLKRIGTEKAISAIIKYGMHNPKAITQRNAYKALVDLRSIKRVQPFIDHGLTRQNMDVVEKSIMILRECKDKRAVEPLIKKLNSKNEMIQTLAAQVLGKLGDERAREPLLKKINSPDSMVRKFSINSLGQIGGKGVYSAIMKELRRTEKALNGKKAAKDSGYALEQSQLKTYCIKALGTLGDKRATPKLLEHLKKSGSIERNDVIRALGRIGDRRALPNLMRLSGHHHKFTKENVGKAIKQIQEANKRGRN